MSKKFLKQRTKPTSGGALARTGFPNLLKEIRARIQQAQTRALLSVNAELVRLYWDIGHLIATRQRQEGWGASIIPRLARELHNELPDEKGFSERNINRMLAFHRAYPDPLVILPQAAAKSRANRGSGRPRKSDQNGEPPA